LLKSWHKNGSIGTKWIGLGSFFIISIFVATGYFLTSATFEAWKNDPISRLLLPPLEPTYFYQYSFFRFWLTSVFDIGMSSAWAFFLLLLYSYSKKRFMDEKEIYLGFFTTLVVGWPNFIIYLFILFGLLAAKQIMNRLIFHKNELVRLAPYMMLSSLVVLGLMIYFNDQLGINEMKIVNRPFFY
jgi:hypothetical protein